LEKRRGRVPGHVGHRHLLHEGKHTEVHQPSRRTAESHHGHGPEPQQVRMILLWGANDVLPYKVPHRYNMYRYGQSSGAGKLYAVRR